MENLGTRIKNKLKERKISQKDLAKNIGITEKQIGRIVRSEVEPGVNKVKAIAKYLDIDLHELITGTSYIPSLQEQKLWRISDGAKEGYTNTRSARHIRVIMNACAMNKEQFAEKLGINLNTLEYYLEHGIPESKIILDIIELGRKADLPIDLKWFVTGTGDK